MLNAYTVDGVNVAAGDDFSAFAAKFGATTHENSPFVEVVDFSHGHFRGPRGFRLRHLPDGAYLDVAPDGIGTKVVTHVAAFTEDQAARDVLAMTCGDITRWGGIPILFTNVLDVSSLGDSNDPLNQRFQNVLRGLVQAANEQGIVVFKGETAELGVCVGSENPDEPMKFNWAGFALGAYDPNRIITGDTLRPGQQVVALYEHGFRSNGISSVRKAFKLKFGEAWWSNPEAKDAVRAAARPSTLYDRFLAELNGWYSSDFKPVVRAHAIVHVTGGGIKSKFFDDILQPRGLSAKLNSLWMPSEIMRQCAE